MITRTTIVNTALGYCGIERINDIEDDSEAAESARLVWDTVYDSFLSEHPWSFAANVKNLVKIVTDQPEQWENVYSVPDDMVSLIALCDRESVFREPHLVHELHQYPYIIMRVDHNKRLGICCNETEVAIVYISNRALAEQMFPKAVEALSVKMACELSIVHKRSSSEFNQLIQLYALRLQEAKDADRHSQSQKMLDNNAYDDARNCGLARYWGY